MPNSELRNYTLEDLSLTPKYFDNDADGHAKLFLVDMYGMLFPNGVNEKPVWWIRHNNPTSTRFAGFFEPGDGYLGLQHQKHMFDIAQGSAKINPYRRIDEKCWGIDCEEPFFEYRFYEDHLTYKEGNFMDIVAKPFSKAIFKHVDNSTSISQITVPCTYEGTYEGKPVKGMGNFELCFNPQNDHRELNSYASYIYGFGSGEREDGRKELYMVSCDLNGNNHGFYWLEGEEPVLDDHAKMETEWVRLPYVNDGTCTYKDITYKVKDKTIHFTGLWGHKGITPWPRVELPGQSQVCGTWYEGDTPYKHTNFLTFHEIMDVFEDRLLKAGFKVKRV